MALNIIPFLGPRGPDWTDSSQVSNIAINLKDGSEKQGLKNSNSYLLLIDDKLKKDKKLKLKKLDILN